MAGSVTIRSATSRKNSGNSNSDPFSHISFRQPNTDFSSGISFGQHSNTDSFSCTFFRQPDTDFFSRVSSGQHSDSDS